MSEPATAPPPTVAGEPPAEPPTGPTAGSRAAAALAAHRQRVRRARRIYGAVVATVVAVALVGVVVAWNKGEISHASLHTVERAPAAIPLAQPAANPAPAWHVSDRLAIGSPQYGGTVITWSAHTVGGRDARTGKPTWSYTRTDRTTCTAAQTTGTTIVVFRLHGNCDEVAGFDSGTGRRLWARTLDKDQRPLDGPVTYQVQPFAFLLTGRTTIYALNPTSGWGGWTYYRYGCTINRAVLGSAGALISQTCGGAVRCSGVKFCARGPQLLLRDGSAGNGDNGDNRDQIKWLQRGDDQAPVAADLVIASLSRDGRTLAVLAAKDGAVQRSVDLGATSRAVPVAVGLLNGELLWRDGTAAAIDTSTSTKPAWTATSSGPPTAVGSGGGAPTTLGSSRITAVAGGAVVTLGGTDGREQGRIPLGLAPGASAYPLGGGFLVDAPSGVTLYR